jgi:PAS domain-containing protein
MAIKDELKKLKSVTEALMEVNDDIFNNVYKWERTFKSVPDPVVVLDINYEVIYANTTVLNKVGGTDEFIGKDCNDIASKLISSADKGPTFLKCLNGWYSYSYSSIEEDGCIIGYIFILKDESETMTLKRELNDVNQELIRVRKEYGLSASV